VHVGLKISTIVTTLGVITAVIGAFIANYTLFLISLGIGEFLVFCGSGPINIVVMSCVPTGLRA